MASQISTFTTSGKRLTGATSRAGVKPTPLGQFDPETGRVYQKPRLKLETIGGSSVRITNPRGSTESARNKRTAGLGMGSAQIQRGRNRDIPGQSG